MTDYVGKNVYMTFVYPGPGTVVLSGDFRTVATNENVSLADVTAGADADRTFIATIKDGNISYAGLHQSAGTALKQALEAGSVGTIVFSPEGTTATNPKETYPVISMGAKMNYPYDGAVEVACEFTKNGARADDVWS